MLDNVTTDDLVEFVVRKGIGDSSKIVDDVRMGPRVGIYANGARVFVLTTPDVENFPRFLVEFSDWNLEPKLSKGQFVFKKSANAKQIELAGRLKQKTE